MKRFHRASLLAAALATALAVSPVHAAGVLIQSFADMAAFQASPFYDYVVNQLPGGLGGNCPWLVTVVVQGDAAVPWSSAGSPGNSTVTPEVETALDGPPTCSRAPPTRPPTTGNSCQSATTPRVGARRRRRSPSPPSTCSAGGFLGYELALIDLGDVLVPASGSKNSERTTFRVEN